MGLRGTLVKAFLAVAGSAVIGNHAISEFLEQTAPTPEEFVRQQNISYHPEGQAFLKDFEDVRVIGQTGWQTRLFWISPLSSLMFEKEETFSSSARSLSPGPFLRLLGFRPLIFIDPPATGSVNANIARPYFGKDIVRPQNLDRVDFDFSLFHELGHQLLAREIGVKIHRVPKRLQELFSDRVALSLLEKEHGESGRKYVTALRAINVGDEEHDTLLSILRPEIRDGEKELAKIDDEGSSHLPFLAIGLACIQQRENKNVRTERLDNRTTYETLYVCLKESSFLRDGSPALSDLSKRARAYVTGYEYLFGAPQKPARALSP